MADQIRALHYLDFGIIALQEVTTKTLPQFREALTKNGYDVISSFDLAEQQGLLTGPRKYGELIASRWGFFALSLSDFPIPWNERVLSVVLDTPWGEIELHTTHIPPGVSNHWIKIDTLEGIYSRLACQSDRLRILCGDFNTPQHETPDGDVITWGQRFMKDGSIKLRRGYQRWDQGERNILQGLADYDFPDVYRELNGYAVQEFSWYWRGKGRKIGRRFDHVFASKSLNPVICRYLHEYRENGLSDHSPIIVEFQPNNNIAEG